jgi:hypothetical protein
MPFKNFSRVWDVEADLYNYLLPGQELVLRLAVETCWGSKRVSVERRELVHRPWVPRIRRRESSFREQEGIQYHG